MSHFVSFICTQNEDDFKFRDDMLMCLLSNSEKNYFFYKQSSNCILQYGDTVTLFFQENSNNKNNPQFIGYCEAVIGNILFGANIRNNYDIPYHADIVDIHYSHLVNCTDIKYPNKKFILKKSELLKINIKNLSSTFIYPISQDYYEIIKDNMFYNSKYIDNYVYNLKMKYNNLYYEAKKISFFETEKKNIYNNENSGSGYMENICKKAVQNFKNNIFTTKRNGKVFSEIKYNDNNKAILKTYYDKENNDLDYNFFKESGKRFYYELNKKYPENRFKIIRLMSNRCFYTAGIRDPITNSLLSYANFMNIEKKNNTEYAPDGIFLIFDKIYAKFIIYIIELKKYYFNENTKEVKFEFSHIEQANKFIGVKTLKDKFISLNLRKVIRINNSVWFPEEDTFINRKIDTAYKYGRICCNLISFMKDINNSISNVTGIIKPDEIKKYIIDEIANSYLNNKINYVFIIDEIDDAHLKEMKELVEDFHESNLYLYTIERNIVINKINCEYYRDYIFNPKYLTL